jgi:hypothetical protein
MEKIHEFYLRLSIGPAGFYDVDQVNFMPSWEMEHYELKSVTREETKTEAYSDYTKVEIRKSEEKVYEFKVKFEDKSKSAELVGIILLDALMISLDQEHFMVSEMLIDRNPSHR